MIPSIKKLTLLVSLLFLINIPSAHSNSWFSGGWWTSTPGGEMRTGGVLYLSPPKVICFHEDLLINLDMGDIENNETSSPVFGEDLTIRIDGIEKFLSKAKRQTEIDWCWAACMSSIMRFHGIQATQENIVKYITKKTKTDGNEAGTLFGILKALDKAKYNGLMTEVYWESTGDPTELIIYDLQNNNPLIAGLVSGDAETGHIYTILGINLFYKEFHGIGLIKQFILWDPNTGKTKEMTCKQLQKEVKFIISTRPF